MARYTKEQIDKWGAKLHNGFKVDVKHLLTFNEKEAVKRIDLGDGKELSASIYWKEVRDGYKYTGLVRPVLHLGLWHEEGGGLSGLMVMSGLGVFLNASDETYTRRSWDKLSKLTAGYNDERLLKLAKENKMILEKVTIA